MSTEYCMTAQANHLERLSLNKPMTQDDIKALEKILWSDLGTKDEYEAEYGDKPLGEFVHEIVGWI